MTDETTVVCTNTTEEMTLTRLLKENCSNAGSHSNALPHKKQNLQLDAAQTRHNNCRDHLTSGVDNQSIVSTAAKALELALLGNLMSNQTFFIAVCNEKAAEPETPVDACVVPQCSGNPHAAALEILANEGPAVMDQLNL